MAWIGFYFFAGGGSVTAAGAATTISNCSGGEQKCLRRRLLFELEIVRGPALREGPVWLAVWDYLVNERNTIS